MDESNEVRRMKILFLDIETSPITAHTWGLWDQNISIGQIVSSTEMMCFGARWYGEKKVIFKSEFHDGKAEMLKSVHELLDEADVLVGWNSKAFDSKHLKREFIENEMLPPSPYKDMDLMLTVKSQFKFPSNKLDYVSQKLGVGAKVKHSGFDLWLGCMAGNAKSWVEMKKYQIQDVDLLVDLYEKLKPWITNHPNRILHDGLEGGCLVCASQKLQRRGTSITASGSYQRFQCQDCGKWQRGPVSINKTTTRNIAF
jgi:DNA polymerase elongation subunit (family B)